MYFFIPPVCCWKVYVDALVCVVYRNLSWKHTQFTSSMSSILLIYFTPKCRNLIKYFVCFTWNSISILTFMNNNCLNKHCDKWIVVDIFNSTRKASIYSTQIKHTQNGVINYSFPSLPLWYSNCSCPSLSLSCNLSTILQPYYCWLQ